MPKPDPKVIKKLTEDIAKLDKEIASMSKLATSWASKGRKPMTTSDEKKLAASAHGIHGKVNYADAVRQLQENIAGAKGKLSTANAKLAAELAKK